MWPAVVCGGLRFSDLPLRLVLISSLLGRQPTGDARHKPISGLSLLSARPAVTFPASELHLRWPLHCLANRGTYMLHLVMLHMSGSSVQGVRGQAAEQQQQQYWWNVILGDVVVMFNVGDSRHRVNTDRVTQVNDTHNSRTTVAWRRSSEYRELAKDCDFDRSTETPASTRSIGFISRIKCYASRRGRGALARGLDPRCKHVMIDTSVIQCLASLTDTHGAVHTSCELWVHKYERN